MHCSSLADVLQRLKACERHPSELALTGTAFAGILFYGVDMYSLLSSQRDVRGLPVE
jgi:hypothetical protein